MQWEQCSKLLPLKHETVPASGHRAHVAVLRKAPGGTCDHLALPDHPWQCQRASWNIVLFLDLHKYVLTTHLIPSLAAKPKGTGISNGTRLDLPPDRVSCISRGWESTAAPCHKPTWDVQNPGGSASTWLTPGKSWGDQSSADVSQKGKFSFTHERWCSSSAHLAPKGGVWTPLGPCNVWATAGMRRPELLHEHL